MTDFTDEEPTNEHCMTCNDEGAIEQSRYGGNDPDTWLVACPDCTEEPEPPEDDDERDYYANDDEPRDIEF